MKFTSIYSWKAIDNVKDGKKVYVLDRKAKTVTYLNDSKLSDVVAATDSDEIGRFEFWYEEEDEGDNE